MDNKKDNKADIKNIKTTMKKADDDYDEKQVPFWSENPNILFHKDYLFEFFPIDTMVYNQKLNAITRTIVLLTIIGLIVSNNVRILIVSVITIFAIFLLHFYHEKENHKKDTKKAALEIKENFENPAVAYLQENNIPIPNDVFDVPSSSNPFSNVLNTDFVDNPHKKPAPPAFNRNVNNDILSKAKQLVVDANPDQPDIADKLFKDLGDQFVFEQSLMPFNSAPASTIPNDQGAFAEFCYGSMVSCKEGNRFACARNLSRHNLY